jgi:Heterokaryon incompatibility protein (HET)
MHQIYENADCVIVWLGEEDEDSNLALEFIAHTSGYDSMDMFVDWEYGEAEMPQPFEYFENCLDDDEAESSETCTQQSLASSPGARDKDKGVLEDDSQGLGLARIKTNAKLARCWAAVYRLLQRPYFRRMWVVQEIAAASLPTVWCGKRRIAWGDLHSACLALMTEWGRISKMWEEFGIDVETMRKGKEINDGTRCLEPGHSRYGITIAHRFAYLRQMNLLGEPLSFLFLALLHR